MWCFQHMVDIAMDGYFPKILSYFFQLRCPFAGNIWIESMVSINYPGQSCLLQSGKVIVGPATPGQVPQKYLLTEVCGGFQPLFPLLKLLDWLKIFLNLNFVLGLCMETLYPCVSLSFRQLNSYSLLATRSFPKNFRVGFEYHKKFRVFGYSLGPTHQQHHLWDTNSPCENYTF